MIRFSLRKQRDLSGFGLPDLEYKPVEDTDYSVLLEICEYLADNDLVLFTFSGHGQYPWPTDLTTELPMLLDRLPRLSFWLTNSSHEDFLVNFFEQGLERELWFSKDGDLINAYCVSYNSWQPEPTVEVLASHELKKMADDFLEEFVTIVRLLFPRLSEAWLPKWLETTV